MSNLDERRRLRGEFCQPIGRLPRWEPPARPDTIRTYWLAVGPIEAVYVCRGIYEAEPFFWGPGDHAWALFTILICRFLC